ncbi:hypothetical protein F53441_6403 [Fusarium austroafricanum]|uniref:Transcription factor domain-containing protein n=1 Tax=Fusarium austroafricanum TaxID=2364996 RepID=A0A8H4KHH8_9HYPO|nr:hypothetical protein F53441_6403 [Fusarium austroafricanum]
MSERFSSQVLKVPRACDRCFSLTLDLSGVIGMILDQTPTHDLDTERAATLIEHIVSTHHSHGLYAAILASPESPGLDLTTSLPRIPTEFSSILTPAIVGSLLSISLDVSQQNAGAISQPSAKLSSNSLRAATLAQIPRILSSYQPTVSDALSLLFFTHTWCFTDEHLETSVRWCAFAHIIITDVIRSRVPLPCALLDLEQRLANSVLQEPRPRSRDWMDAYDEIEQYYILFPASLLRFEDLDFLYQAESMIWMHGLFMILYVGRDPLNIILKPDVLDDDTLRHVLGHSLLLGEILPSIERLGGDLNFLSPAVVFFLVVSCAVHIAILGKYLNDLGDEEVVAGMELDSPPTLSVPSPPEKLMLSSKVHLRLLSSIIQKCKRKGDWSVSAGSYDSVCRMAISTASRA